MRRSFLSDHAGQSFSWLVNSIISWFGDLRICLAAALFRPYRADYYTYLGEMIGQKAGGKTLLKILETDARRYDQHGARGILARHWARRLSLASGDIYATFERTLPPDDVMAIRTAQHAGGQSLSKVLCSLGRCVQLYDEAKKNFTTTVLVGVCAWLVAALSLIAIPCFTHDRLFTAFSMIPPDYYGLWTSRFVGFAQYLGRLWPVAIALFACLVMLLAWSVGHYVGRFRPKLDRWFIWKLYRSLHAMRFLSLLSVLIQPQGSDMARLRHAIAAMTGHRSSWLEHHLQTMLQRIDIGVGSIQALDTRLIDEQTWWYLCDVAEIAGLDQAIFRTSERLGSRALADFKRCALQIRWSLLFGALAVVMAVALWHFKVIDELRQSMSIVYALH